MAAKMQPSNAAGLAKEIVCNIAARLGSDDLINLRLSCRALQAKTFHEFATEYFRSKCIHLTSDSLKSLVAITENEQLRPYLQEVYVSTKIFDTEIFDREKTFFDCIEWKPPTKIGEAYRTLAQDQAKLRATGMDCQMLTTIFKNVKKLNLIAMIDTATALDHTTDYRGYRKFLRTACEGPSSVDPSPLRSYYAWQDHVFSIMLEAMKTSEIQVLSLKTEFKCVADATGPENFCFDKRSFEGLRTVHFWSLTTLSLQLSMGMGCCDPYKHMIRAGRIFPNVTDVHLRFGRDEEGEGQDALFASFVGSLKVEKLTRLSIVDLYCYHEVLGDILYRLEAVQVLKLEGVTLLDDYEEEDWTENWTTMLSLMRRLKQLNHLHAIYPRQDIYKVYFLKDRSDADVAATLNEAVRSSESKFLKQDEAIFQRDFTNWAFPRSCGESVVHHCRHGSIEDPRRGYYVCLPSKAEIKRQLPKFIEELQVGYDDDDD